MNVNKLGQPLFEAYKTILHWLFHPNSLLDSTKFTFDDRYMTVELADEIKQAFHVCNTPLEALKVRLGPHAVTYGSIWWSWLSEDENNSFSKFTNIAFNGYGWPGAIYGPNLEALCSYIYVFVSNDRDEERMGKFEFIVHTHMPIFSFDKPKRDIIVFISYGDTSTHNNIDDLDDRYILAFMRNTANYIFSQYARTSCIMINDDPASIAISGTNKLFEFMLFCDKYTKNMALLNNWWDRIQDNVDSNLSSNH